MKIQINSKKFLNAIEGIKKCKHKKSKKESLKYLDTLNFYFNNKTLRLATTDKLVLACYCISLNNQIKETVNFTVDFSIISDLIKTIKKECVTCFDINIQKKIITFKTYKTVYQTQFNDNHNIFNHQAQNIIPNHNYLTNIQHNLINADNIRQKLSYLKKDYKNNSLIGVEFTELNTYNDTMNFVNYKKSKIKTKFISLLNVFNSFKDEKIFVYYDKNKKRMYVTTDITNFNTSNFYIIGCNVIG